ncbi:MAG TPA: Arm DNA-binding domain-containing protein, partial [Candidatus Solibacter sp.]|nr:Arm DNA-binding domain-containing protein [Candidatus Solibacter sp.]
MKLTAKNLNSARLPDGKSDHIAWDDDIPGLGLRLRAGGSRVWVFQYALGRKQRRMALGAAT